MLGVVDGLFLLHLIVSSTKERKEKKKRNVDIFSWANDTIMPPVWLQLFNRYGRVDFVIILNNNSNNNYRFKRNLKTRAGKEIERRRRDERRCCGRRRVKWWTEPLALSCFTLLQEQNQLLYTKK